MSVMQQAAQVVEQNQGWTWATLLSTAVMSWIAPVAGLVTIGLGCLQGYISWQKYRHWKRTIKEKQ